MTSSTSNTDSKELQQFNRMQNDWWNPEGVCKLLHRMNPVRLAFIKNQVGNLSGKRILDVGCGGGILTESLAKEGAFVTGLEPAEELIETAKDHAKQTALSIQYRKETAEEFLEIQPEPFYLITCMELLEHVPNPESVIKACSSLLQPGGH